MKIVVTSSRDPFPKKTFYTAEGAAEYVSRITCDGCKTTKGDLHSLYDVNRMEMYEREGFKEDIDAALPDDWVDMSSWGRLNLLLTTECGEDMVVEVIDD